MVGEAGGEEVFFSCGSNLGERFEYMNAMVESLAQLLQQPLRCSRLMETQPVGVSQSQPWYLNCIYSGRYHGEPQELLKCCLAIETTLGRERTGYRAARTADIDILLFGDLILRTPELVVPHPGILERKYCLQGLLELAPTMIIPGSGITVEQHFDQMAPALKNQQLRFV
jgi:2-amino-4-hydroxy-6-hydroxymethyldihydropteridine diphosphokinase